MTEGTKSYLFGCHQFFMHPLMVIIAWIKLFNSFPMFWELVCIFLHDIGHIGKNYLSDYEQKKKYWELGANIADKLFGKKGYYLIALHTKQSGIGKNAQSTLLYADKYSWVIAPVWWLRLNDKVEAFGKQRSLETWRKMVKENWDKGCPQGNHEIYLDITKFKIG